MKNNYYFILSLLLDINDQVNDKASLWPVEKSEVDTAGSNESNRLDAFHIIITQEP